MRLLKSMQKQSSIAAFFSPKAIKMPEEAKENTKRSLSPLIKPAKVAKLEGREGPSSESASYLSLCETFVKIEGTTKRLEIMALLTKYFEEIIKTHPHDLVRAVYLCLNRTGPEYEAKELGVGESLLIKAVAGATGRALASIKADVKKQGDLGSVAQSSKGAQGTMFAPKPLTISSVFTQLIEIANMSGTHSQTRKVDAIQKLIAACKGPEPRFLIRSLEGKLRIGLAEQTILVSLAQATALHSYPEIKKGSIDKRTSVLAEATAVVKQVYSEIPNYDMIVASLLEFGYKELANSCQLTPGVPLKPMLAHPTKSISEVLNRFEGHSFICEYKYDGERAQIHLVNGMIKVFSRNSENLSEKYPDIVSRMPKILMDGVTSFVMDCEAVAWDREKNCILPFQVLSTRKRKDVNEKEVQVQVCVYAFDLLYLNGKPLVKESLRTRRELLKTHFNEVPGLFMFAQGMISNEVDAIQTFLDDSVSGNCEGLMVKTLDKDSSYEPSKRSRNWLKVKKDYIDGVGDSLDLVVIGGYTGKGKRTGWYGGYLLACYDEDREEYQSICKIGTGFTEEQFKADAEFFKPHIIDNPKPYYLYTDTPNIKPDVWFEPVTVWEVKAADLSISPVHKAGMGIVDPNKGISLRFPRFIRVRDDKSPEQATSASQVAEFYKSQSIIMNNVKKSADDDFEY